MKIDFMFCHLFVRLRRGLDPVTGDDVTAGATDNEAGTADDLLQAAALRSNSFDVAPSGYIAPTVAWFTGLLLPEFENQQQQQPAADQTQDNGNRTSGAVLIFT